MNFDFIAYPLGKFMKFIYDTIAFNNYGLAIIIFTLIVRLVLLPLTLKQYKSSAKMQELQPIIADIQKRYKDDKEKMNQELMKVYQENNYNPAGGCLPMLVQFPIIITLYWVIIQPLKFMLGKSKETIDALVEVARTGMNLTAQQMMGTHRELSTLNYFNENRDALSKVKGMLEQSELIDFNNFLGLHLGETAKYNPSYLFGEHWKIYLPLFILVILATVTTFISSKLAMPPKPQNNGGESSTASSMSNTMLYIGPLMTLMFSFQLPAGVILYWMSGYIFAIFQQLYINKYVMKRNNKTDGSAGAGNKTKDGSKALGGADNKALKSAGAGSAEVDGGGKQLAAGEAGSEPAEKETGNESKGVKNKNSSKKRKGKKG